MLCVTGGPGTGKTTVLRTVVDRCEGAEERTMLLAPTGKAAARLSAATGRSARTVHRALEWDGAAGRFRRSEHRHLDADVVIVDEASMLDSHLCDSLMRACSRSARVILCGDGDQLPPVGPGAPFLDVMAWGSIPVVRLQGVHRQGAGSPIIAAAESILRGDMPASAGAPGDAGGAFLVILRADPESVAATVADVAAERLPARGFHARDVQVLCARREEAVVSAAELNTRLAPRMNPGAPPKGFWLRDRVVQLTNDYDREVFNGQVGEVVSVQRNMIRVLFDDAEDEVEYGPAMMRQLARAFCLTTHKSQGSEYPAVIVAIDDTAGPLLHRSLLYTAVTRAKRACVVVSTASALRRCVETPAPPRPTWLALKLAEG